MKNKFLQITSEIELALKNKLPVVALESAVITHGLPYPKNIELALDLEKTIRLEGAVPATIGFIKGQIHIGLNQTELEVLASSDKMRKISRRDFAIALAEELSGGTTVSGTLSAAYKAGIHVFSTGGIGGVHLNAPFDISNDLFTLAIIPMIVVCSGAKAILNLPATREVLETLGIPILGYQTNEFPAFYSSHSGLNVDMRVNSADEIANISKAHWNVGINSSILVAVPPPLKSETKTEQVTSALQAALLEVKKQKIHGPAVTPFLLNKMSELTNGASLQVNLDLLINNAKIAAQIAKVLMKPTTRSQRKKER